MARQIVLSLLQLDKRSKNDAGNASRKSRSFGRENLLNVEGLIRFYSTKYNIIVSQTLYQNLLNQGSLFGHSVQRGIGHLVRSAFLLAFQMVGMLT